MMEVQAQYIRLLAEVSMIRPVIQRQSWQHNKDRGHGTEYKIKTYRAVNGSSRSESESVTRIYTDTLGMLSR